MKVEDALEDPEWINAMHEELHNFERNQVWTLVEKPDNNHNIIGTKWVFRNKQDKDGQVVRNKARLVAQGYTQVEGMDYGETCALIARLESIRILLAYANHYDITLYQMDIKSAFLNGEIEEEVYVKQPPGFVNPKKHNHVYKLHKALYGLKQAPRACINASPSSLLQVVLKLVKLILLFLLKGLMGNYSYAKFMLMISYLVQLTLILVKSLESLCRRSLRCL